MSKRNKNVVALENQTRTILHNKYWNLWFSKYETDLDRQTYYYLMKQYWNDGTIGGFKIKHTDELGLAPWLQQRQNQYGLPEVIRFVNNYNSPIIPSGEHVVNEDCVIGYCQSNHKSIRMIVDYYIDKLVEMEMIINTQLQSHKLPLLIGITPEDEQKARGIVEKLLNNEPVIFMDLQDINLVKTLVNGNTPILDKLVEHKQTIECELLTFLGLDNAVSQKVNLDITNSNNSVINAFKDDIDYNIQNFVEECQKYLGITFYMKQRQQEILSVYEEDNPELENNTTKEGVVGGGPKE